MAPLRYQRCKVDLGGEAVAVRQDGRANPHQLLMTPTTQTAIASLRDETINAHRERFGANADSDLWIGLQLTHSGRYARPSVHDRPEPLAGAAHPVLDRRFPNGFRVLSDAESIGWWTISLRRRDALSTADISSSTSKPVMDIWGMRCSAPAADRANTAARWRIAPVSCGR